MCNVRLLDCNVSACCAATLLLLLLQRAHIRVCTAHGTTWNDVDCRWMLCSPIVHDTQYLPFARTYSFRLNRSDIRHSLIDGHYRWWEERDRGKLHASWSLHSIICCARYRASQRREFSNIRIIHRIVNYYLHVIIITDNFHDFALSTAVELLWSSTLIQLEECIVAENWMVWQHSMVRHGKTRVTLFQSNGLANLSAQFCFW